MSYFSRLTDIVTCNLSALLAEAEDPQLALLEIIAEMREGLAGAKRSVATATASERRLAGEIAEQQAQAALWDEKARTHLKAAAEETARSALLRKREALDLIAGLEQQHRAALATKEHLSTMQRTLEARLADALRRQENPAAAMPAASGGPEFTPPKLAEHDPSKQIDSELESMKRELGLK